MEIRPFRTDDIEAILRESGGPCVSLYLPTHNAGPEIRQDPIRLKNLIRDAEDKLSKNAFPLLDPAREMLNDQSVWRHMSRGLVLFLSPRLTAIRSLPIDPGPHAVVQSGFFIRPLLPHLMPARRFYLLAVDAERPRLYLGDSRRLTSILDGTLEASFKRIRALTEFQGNVGFHATGPAPTTGGTATPKYHSQGESPDDYKQTQLDQFAREFAKEIDGYLKGERHPLVVLSNPRLLGLYRRHSSYPGLVEDGIDKNPSTLSEDEMLDLALRKIGGLLEAPVREAVERFEMLSGDRDRKVTTDAAVIVSGAIAGRVDTLLCATDGQCWGAVDGLDVHIHGERRSQSADLIDRCAAETIRNGGSVVIPAEHEMPDEAVLAAIFRG